MKVKDHSEDPRGIHEVVLPAAMALVTEPPSRAWRRRLGPLAWVALEHLALSSHLTDHGWEAPLGVRDPATGIGVTKDTAARAVAILRAAGLVVLTRVENQDGRKRSGYQLHLPAPLQLFACPVCEDSPSNRMPCCPEGKYEGAAGFSEGACKDHAPAETECIPHQDSGPKRVGRRSPNQLLLFDAPIPTRNPSTGEKA